MEREPYADFVSADGQVLLSPTGRRARYLGGEATDQVRFPLFGSVYRRDARSHLMALVAYSLMSLVGRNPFTVPGPAEIAGLDGRGTEPVCNPNWRDLFFSEWNE